MAMKANSIISLMM